MIPDDDRGFLLGDGLFETILWQGGELIAFEAHVARLTRSCAAIGLALPDPARLRSAALTAVEPVRQGRAVVRLNWSAGSGRGLDRPAGEPRLVATAAEAPRTDGSLTLVTSLIRRNETSPLSRVKALSYLDNVLARREAKMAGADQALMLNTRGDLACADAANLFWVKGEVLFTPALECGVLAGIARAEILSRASEAQMTCLEVAAGPEALFDADAVFLTNSLIGARPVAVLDGRSLNQQAEQMTVLLIRGRR